MNNLIDWIKKNLKQHTVDSTALLVESTPIFAAYETMLAGMSYDVSMNARLIAAGLVYGGLGSLFTKGRDLWRGKFNITEKTNEKMQIIHDALYSGAFNLVASPLLYYASGSRDSKEIAIGTALSIGVGSANGAPLGYAIDLFKDLTGLKDCERPSYPKLLKNLKPKTKKSLAALALAGSIGLTAGVYSLTPNEETNYSDNSQVAYSEVNNLEREVINQIIK